MVDQRGKISLPGTMSDKQMLFFKRKNFMVLFLKLNEDLVREMTIGHPPQREEMNPRTSQSPKDLKPVAQCFKEFFFLVFFIFFFSLQTTIHNYFYQTQNSKLKFTFLSSL